MKYFLLSCLLLQIFNNSHAAQKSTQLSGDNLSLLALTHATDEALNQHALFLLKTQNSVEYYKSRKDQERIKQLIDEQKKQVLTNISQIDHQTRFGFSEEVRFKNIDTENNSIDLSSLIKGTTKVISRNNHKDDGLPNHFKLLIANTDLLTSVKVDAEELTKLQEKGIKKLFVDVEVVLPYYQNQQNFQTIIDNIKVYLSKEKQTLIAHIKENRNAKKLADSWWLAGGITSKLVGIHSFSFSGYRAQDMIVDANKLNGFCKKTKKLGPHQVLVCLNPYTENTKLIVTYIGGVIGQIDLIATGALSPAEKKKLSRHIMLQLDKKRNIFEQEHTRWSKYNVDFDFYADAFLDEINQASRYQFKYGQSKPAVNERATTIISIISQATKKQVEENT